jgi:hypothetical protein
MFGCKANGFGCKAICVCLTAGPMVLAARPFWSSGRNKLYFRKRTIDFHAFKKGANVKYMDIHRFTKEADVKSMEIHGFKKKVFVKSVDIHDISLALNGSAGLPKGLKTFAEIRKMIRCLPWTMGHCSANC